MAISRLFVADTKLQLLTNRGFLKRRRWFCSQSSSPDEKTPMKIHATEEAGIGTIKSFFRRYIQNLPVVPRKEELHEVSSTEMESNILSSNIQVKQAVVETSDNANLLESSSNIRELNRPDKAFSVSEELLGVDKSDITKVAKILENTEVTETKQVEQMSEHSRPQPDRQTSVEAETGKDNVFLDMLSDIEKTLTKKVNYSDTPKISNNTEFAETKLMEMLYVEDSCDPSVVNISDPRPDDGCQSLPGTTGTEKLHSTEVTSETKASEEISLPKDSHNMILSETKQTEMSTSISIEELSRTLTQDSSTTTDTSLFGLRNNHLPAPNAHNRRETKEVDSHETENFLKERNHVTSLINAFRRKQIDCGDSSPKEKLEQTGRLKSNEVSGGDAENPIGGRSFYDHLMSRVLQKAGESSSEDKRESSSYVNNIINQLPLCEEHVSSDPLPRAELLKVKSTKDMDKVAGAFTATDRREDNTKVNLNGYSKSEANKVITPSENAQIHSSKNLLLVKFLPKTASMNDLTTAFGDCGVISGTTFVNSEKENKFIYAYISFKSKTGLKGALSKGSVSILDTDVIVEGVCASNTSNKTVHAGKVKDLDFPMDLVKNPSRTVIVKGSPDSLTFGMVKGSLMNVGNVSSIVMGSSFYKAYAELESERVKEMALAKATKSVGGKKVQILRLDTPPTTVVRISNLSPFSKLEKIRDICGHHGQVKKVIRRDIDVIDVHFAFSEWANIVHILNRLNGMVLDKYQLLAQPATVIPTEVLHALWNKPDGRKHIYKMIQSICQKNRRELYKYHTVAWFCKRVLQRELMSQGYPNNHMEIT